MASRNRPSKSERQRRNRAQRDARRARSQHAGEATGIARDLSDSAGTDDAGPDDGVETDVGTAKTSSRRTSGAATSKSGRGRGRKGSPFDVPGQRAVVLAFLFSIASIGLLIFTPVRVEREVPEDDPRVEQADDPEITDDGTAIILEDVKLLEEETLAIALMIMITPVAITGAAAYYSKHPKRSTIWTMAMLGIAGYVFFIGGAYAIYTLPALVALGVGGFQARRADNAERMAELKAQRAARKAAKAEGREVIDVDAVDEDKT